jgi:hypothetical protein
MYGIEFDVPDVEDVVLPIGKARIRREGADVTLVAHSRMVKFALEAAEELAGQGIEAEVIDLRSLRPLDTATVIESVKKTNRIVCCEEGWRFFGVGAEIAAAVTEHAFDYLDAPPMRVAQKDVPLPYAANLEKLSLPNAQDIVAAAKKEGRVTFYTSQPPGAQTRFVDGFRKLYPDIAIEVSRGASAPISWSPRMKASPAAFRSSPPSPRSASEMRKPLEPGW